MNRTLFLFVASIVAILLCQVRVARAEPLTYCMSTYAEYVDNGTGASNESAATDGYQALNGVIAFVNRHATSSCSSAVVSTFGLATDYAGCATFEGVRGVCYDVLVYAAGVPASTSGGLGNSLSVRDLNDTQQAWLGSVVPTNVTSLLFVGPSAAFRIYATLARTMRFFTAGMTGQTINAYLGVNNARCPCSNGAVNGSFSCGMSSTVQHICVSTTAATDATARKYVMSHEYGHALVASTGSFPNNDCSWNGAGHGMDTHEYSGCGIAEGWANFVAVDVWNDHPTSVTNPGGRIGYWSSTLTPRVCNGAVITPNAVAIDAEFGTGGSAVNACPVAYMEAAYSPPCVALGTCGAEPYAGLANELDWMRAFWDFHTNGFGGTIGTVPTHADLRQMWAATNWGSSVSTAYDRYRLGVAAAGGCVQYERLVAMSEANGTDHCAATNGTCQDVPGCTNVD